MAKKRKFNKTPPVNKTGTTDLSKENVNNQSTTFKKTLANISHKKSHGANNWQLYKKSILSNKCDVKPSNEKTNQSHKIVNNESKYHNTVFKPTSKSLDQISISKKLPLNKCSIDNTSTSVMNKNIHIVPVGLQKQSVANENLLTKRIAMDCEMVGVEIGVNQNMLARISLVNYFGDCVYDKFVKPTEPVLDYRTRISGVRPKDLENAEDFKTVQKEVADILKGRILIGHALNNDLKVLFFSHPKQYIRDTSRFKKFREGRTPSLKKLAKKYLGVSIQEGEHSSVQDAMAAMQLYRMFQKDWEGNLKKRHAIKLKKERKNSKTMLDV